MKKIHIILFLFTLSISIGHIVSYGKGKSDVDEMMKNAGMYFEDGLYKSAEREYMKILEIDPTNARVYNELGMIASLDDRRIRDSINYFIKSIKLDPRYADPFANMAIICQKIKNYGTAETYLKRAISLDPENPQYRFTLGWIYYEQKKNYDDAIELFNSAIGLDPKYADSHYALGLVYVDLGKHPEVLESVTNLRLIKKEGLASKLEELIRPEFKDMPDVFSPKPRDDVDVVYSVIEKEESEVSPIPLRLKGRMSADGYTTQGKGRIVGDIPRTRSKGRVRGERIVGGGSGRAVVQGRRTIQLELHVRGVEPE